MTNMMDDGYIELLNGEKILIFDYYNTFTLNDIEYNIIIIKNKLFLFDQEFTLIKSDISIILEMLKNNIPIHDYLEIERKIFKHCI